MRKPDATPALIPPRAEMHRAFAARDAAYDGVFFVAVRTTGIFCRPSCPSRPNPENVEFLATIRDCLFAGYRPCKRCRPTEIDGSPPDWAGGLMKLVTASADGRLKEADLRALGVAPERARRWFQENYGLTFAAWCRARRLADAFTRIREGLPLDDAGLEAGYESQSGFRDAFQKVFGTAPGHSRAAPDAGAAPIIVGFLETPLGRVVAGATDAGVCLVEYTDRRMLEANFARMRERFRCPILPGEHSLLDRLHGELGAYFEGRLRNFTVPLAPRGTQFQQQVWNELRRIPHGETLSYEALAQRVGRPTGQRAVAQANGLNRICILIPCHRVIGKNGELIGYGAGLWRKRLLIELERTGHLPGRDSQAPSLGSHKEGPYVSDVAPRPRSPG